MAIPSLPGSPAGFTGDVSTVSSINPSRATAEQLLADLQAGRVTSVELVNLYLKQIQAQNKEGLKLNAVISTAPIELISKYANMLDEERAAGNLRGPLHGIPIIVKDNIMTDWELGMGTTCGAEALVNAKARNAPIIDKLLQAGALIIAKANLSVSFGIMTGWSAVGGQTQTPYVRGGYKEGDKILGHSTPCGSSSGSAAAVAAGFAPLTIATESDGSVTQPAGRASLYALKVTVGSLSTKRTSPQSPLTDSLGGMAKTANDLALLIGAMTENDYSSFLTKTWAGQRVAFVDPRVWGLHPAFSELAVAVNVIRDNGGVVSEGVVLPQVDDISWEGQDALETIWDGDLAHGITSFLEEYESANVRSTEELIKWNEDHRDVALPPAFPGQQQLEGSVKNTLSAETREQIISFIRRISRDEGFEKIFNETDTDVLMGPLDGRIVTVAVAAGYPCGVVPLGYADDLNGRAYGAVFVVRPGEEGKLLQVMSAWEATMPSRKSPPLLDTLNPEL
ncbi:hypothetical protein VTL71DRAFT_3732 [Oculimacula yallundae]|uniref:Amidase domain-containing protein n=1 Tax=Oculimacula yallundae TaxID=86028 RepID=A0ABR4C3W0_9HELO